MQNFYKGKSILVTGSTGFKGSWLAFRLHHLGAKVIGYALEPNTNPNLFSALNLSNKIEQVIGDISDVQLLSKTIEKHQPEMIFHLAAQPLVRESYNNPIYTMQTNVMGTANVMEMMRIYDFLDTAIVITTDKVYENKEWIYPYRECDRLGGFDPYSSSKAMSELVVDSYKKSFLESLGKKIATVRAGNVVGGGDRSADRLIPDIVKTLMKDESLTLRSPNAVRPWQYVLEALYGYLLLGQKMHEDPKYCSSYNFGPNIDDSIKVLEVVKKSIEILGKGNYLIDETLNQKMHEAGLLLLDNTKSRTLLGWKPKYTVHETLEKTFEWYKGYYEGENIEELSLKEINNF